MEVGAIANGASGTSTATKGLAENFETFLTLLTVQLQNQDPLEPLDSGEFTSQLVQFTSVEQSIATNKHLEALVALSTTSAANAAVGYLGQEVTAEGGTAQLKDGSARWNYSLEIPSSLTSITVTDQFGRVVYTGDGEKGAGDHGFDWDGRDTNGYPMPNGLYTLKVTANDAVGNGIATKSNVTGIVRSVSMEGAEPVLNIDGISVRLRDVLTIVDRRNPDV